MRPLTSPEFERDYSSESIPAPNSRDQAPFNGIEVSNRPSAPVQELLPPPAEEMLPPIDACGSDVWGEPGVVLVVAPLEVS